MSKYIPTKITKDGIVRTAGTQSILDAATGKGWSLYSADSFAPQKVYKNGESRTAGSAEVLEAAKKKGWTTEEEPYASFEEDTSYDEEAEPGLGEHIWEATKDVGETALATVMGGVRGATLGTSDVAIPVVAGAEGAKFSLFTDEGMGEAYSGHSGATKDYLQELKEDHPIASTIGELGGIILPAMTGIGAPAAVSRGAEAIVSRVFTNESAKLGARIARAGAKGALETAPYSVGGQISNNALDDDASWSAESIILDIGLC